MCKRAQQQAGLLEGGGQLGHELIPLLGVQEGPRVVQGGCKDLQRVWEVVRVAVVEGGGLDRY